MIYEKKKKNRNMAMLNTLRRIQICFQISYRTIRYDTIRSIDYFHTFISLWYCVCVCKTKRETPLPLNEAENSLKYMPYLILYRRRYVMASRFDLVSKHFEH